MMPQRYLIPAIVLSLALFSISVQAGVVVLKTGKIIEVEKVWQENGQIWIVYHGMRASIPPGKVERIENDSNNDPGKLDLKNEKPAKLKEITRSTPQAPPAFRQTMPHRRPQRHSQRKLKKIRAVFFPMRALVI
jgi:hypothetical protein